MYTYIIHFIGLDFNCFTPSEKQKHSRKKSSLFLSLSCTHTLVLSFLRSLFLSIKCIYIIAIYLDSFRL